MDECRKDFEAGWNAAYSNMDDGGPTMERALERYLEARTEAKVSGEQLTEWAMEALEEFRAELPAPQSPVVLGVDAIEGLLYRNSTDEADDGKWIEAKDYRKVAEAIAHLLANARESWGIEWSVERYEEVYSIINGKLSKEDKMRALVDALATVGKEG